ncbi:MAG: 3-phenylpropionate MFS transporter [Rhodospirillaceae bacterium TMED8]|nr:3-phenylpropionate MFS transporter [Magnetovibrio sp.]OUT50865.1 MAG: 3-phenylpropionate MFS transporter [Rhodospirillaceae bacterium TMED8]|tara:strand:+ start:1527 stop:2657 length:1131 start_codon:yes stop_codon:yes gene_type:complete
MINLRFALYYSTAFAVVGILMPFWPLWLQSKGLNVENIGAVMALGIAIKTLTNPMIAGVADVRGERKRIMSILIFLAVLTFALFHNVQGFWGILVITLMFQMCWSPNMPLMESLVMQTAKQNPINYGRVRLWGSMTFILSAWGLGYLLKEQPIDLVYWGALLFLMTTFFTTLSLPDTRIPRPQKGHQPLIRVLGDRTFVSLVIACGLIQSSHAVYYTFGTIHWQTAGHSEPVIGWLWAEGVIAEVVLFIWGAALIKKIGATKLIALGGLAGLIRWVATGLTDALPALMILQLLHAFTFAATHLGAIYFIANRIDSQNSATAQSVYAGLVMGLALGLSVWVSGMLYANINSDTYHVMAVMAAIGGILAHSLKRPSNR